jgi:hypothetical protein
MLEHHIQKAIVYKLAFSPGLRFSELKPAELDNKLFNYHLKLVVKSGLVKKDDAGLYVLTSKGRRVGVGALDKQFADLDRAHSVVFLIVQRQVDNAWLLFRRLTHPLINQAGLIHVNPLAKQAIIHTAQDQLCETTGIKGSFTYVGNGYFKVYKDAGLESFTHFTVLACQNALGELQNHNPKGEYFWCSDLKAIQNDLLPTAQVILEQYLTGQTFFVDQTFNL